MRKILLLCAFFSMGAWANPFPETCEKFLSTIEEAINHVAKEDLEKAKEMKQFLTDLTDMKDVWAEIQTLDTRELREHEEKMITDICEQGLKGLNESLGKIKTENK